MTAATHIAIGAGISTVVGNPFIGFGAAFLSHFLVDMIPHGDYFLSEQMRTEKKMRNALAYGIGDYVVAISLFFLFFLITPFVSVGIFIAAAIGSIMPDILVGIYDVTKTKYLRWFNTLHFWFHDMILKRTGDVRLEYAIVGQVIFIVVVAGTI